jgi:hypothetical protein
MTADAWTLIHERNARRERAEASRAPAWSMDVRTGTVRQDESDRCQVSFIEMCIAETK